jgi:ABC-type antimicrobial peptide transport system permease subunit
MVIAVFSIFIYSRLDVVVGEEYSVTLSASQITQEEFLRDYNYGVSMIIGFLVLSVIIYTAMLLNVVNIISASLNERRKTLMTIRRLGVEHKTMKNMLISEVLIVSIISSVVGLLGGVAVTLLLARDLVARTSLSAVLSQSPWPLWTLLFLANIMLAVLAIAFCLRFGRVRVEGRGYSPL